MMRENRKVYAENAEYVLKELERLKVEIQRLKL